jgi:hypothetical protein
MESTDVTYYTREKYGQTHQYPVSEMALLLSRAAGRRAGTLPDYVIRLAESAGFECSEVFKPRD